MKAHTLQLCVRSRSHVTCGWCTRGLAQTKPSVHSSFCGRDLWSLYLTSSPFFWGCRKFYFPIPFATGWVYVTTMSDGLQWQESSVTWWAEYLWMHTSESPLVCHGELACTVLGWGCHDVYTEQNDPPTNTHDVAISKLWLFLSLIFGGCLLSQHNLT